MGLVDMGREVCSLKKGEIFGICGIKYRNNLTFLCLNRYTKLGYAGNTEPQFIIPSCKYLLLVYES